MLSIKGINGIKKDTHYILTVNSTTMNNSIAIAPLIKYIKRLKNTLNSDVMIIPENTVIAFDAIESEEDLKVLQKYLKITYKQPEGLTGGDTIQ